MGASVSVCNLTTVIINVALRHASPLYYQNQVLPTQCAEFKTGRVWFTVEAKVWINGTNEYTDAQVALPIAGASLVAPVVAGFVTVVGLAEAGKRKQLAKPTEPPVFEWRDGNFTEVPFPTMSVTNTGKAAIGAGVAGGIVAIPGAAIGIAGAVVNTDNHTPKEWRIQKLGVYMTPGKRINIRGGPVASAVRLGKRQGFKYQYINNEYNFDPLKIDVQ